MFFNVLEALGAQHLESQQFVCVCVCVFVCVCGFVCVWLSDEKVHWQWMLLQFRKLDFGDVCTVCVIHFL